jgi:peptide/nickel transport system substrate-binding protein
MTRKWSAGLVTPLIGLALMGAAQAQQKPQYGGTVEVATVFATLSALSWDPLDWNWKLNHDAGQIYEQLIVGDLDKSRRKGGAYDFVFDSYLPTDSQKGELAESWSEDGKTVTFRLRKGVMFPGKPGVMPSRELTADDVVFSFDRLRSSPKALASQYEFIDKVEAEDRYTVVYTLNKYNADWDFRLGWGFNSAVMPKEVAEAGAANWKNVNGTGPFMLTDFVQGNSNTYAKNPVYWGREKIDGVEYRIPFVDKLVYRTIKDEATQLSALRSAKIDILEMINARHVPELKKSAPDLKWHKWLSVFPSFVSLRNDVKPFDDVRVRRAVNMAINKQEILTAHYGGDAELYAYPMHPDWTGYYEPLAKLPAAARELFEYNPEKAKKLLVEAGYPKGFRFPMEYCTCSPDHVELAPLLAAYLDQVGVTVELKPMEYAAFLSAMTSRKHAAGYLMFSSYNNPTVSIRKNFTTGHTWNSSMRSDPRFDAKMDEIYDTRDEAKRQAMLRALTAEIVTDAPYIWLPTPYVYTAWWPWVMNYGGELSLGAVRPGPAYARLWLDQALKKKLGR